MCVDICVFLSICLFVHSTYETVDRIIIFIKASQWFKRIFSQCLLWLTVFGSQMHHVVSQIPRHTQTCNSSTPPCEERTRHL